MAEYTAAIVSRICDPEHYGLEGAIQQALVVAESSDRFEVDLTKFLRIRSLANRVNHQTIFRGLEVLGAILPESRLAKTLGPFLRSSDPQIASKAVLILGRRSETLASPARLLLESDDRVRANMIEALWNRREPEIERVLKEAMNDQHHRVAANAVHGLYLLGSNAWREGIRQLIGRKDPMCRRAAIWELKSSGDAGAASAIKPMIHDSDLAVRRAAFKALVSLRQNGAAQDAG